MDGRGRAAGSRPRDRCCFGATARRTFEPLARSATILGWSGAIAALLAACAPFGSGTPGRERAGDGPDATDGSVGSDPRDGSAGADAPDGAAADAGARVCARRPDCERYVFVTSRAAPSGALRGIAQADALCDELARKSAIPEVQARRFVAWIATEASPASARLVHGAASYRRVDAVKLAAGWDDLTDGSIDEVLDVDENGARVGSVPVFTGSLANGDASGWDCEDWTSDFPSRTASGGRTSEVGPGWSTGLPYPCSEPARLYCFEE